MNPNILHITPDFNYACGRSYYVYLLLKYFKQTGYNVILATNGGDSLDRLDDLQIPCRIIKPLQSKTPVSFSKSVSELKKIILENDIDIIHSHHRYSEFIALHLAKSIKKRKIKTVFTSLSIVRRKYNIEYRSDRIIAVSRVIEKMLTERFKVKKEKIELISNFVDTDELKTFSSAEKSVNNGFNILAIGRFHPEKNFGLLLKALKIINDKSFRLVLIGEGPELNNYKKFISKNHLNVSIAGPQKYLNKYYREADVCVLPSSRDPFPNFMLQSGLFSKPFIGSNVDGIPELIADGYNGLIFENGDANGLAEKLISIKNDTALAEKCATNLHSDVMNSYTQNSNIPKTENLYKKLIS